MEQYDFSGWATKANLKCSDGRVIMKDAFKQNDGQTVPLVWNHSHNDPNEVLGHALLENRDEGVYAYCKFNNTETGKTAKLLVQHGDVKALSIYANQLKQSMSNVIHGNIRELSLVLAGANPGACIESVLAHGEESDEEAIVYTGEPIELYHADEFKKEEKKVADEKKEPEKETEKKPEDEETVADVFNTLTDKQKNVVYAMIGQALEDDGESDEDDDDKSEVKHSDKEGDDGMKKNVFDKDDQEQTNFLSHSDQASILAKAKQNSCGSFRDALGDYVTNNTSLQHGIDPDDYDKLLPDWHDTGTTPPEFVENDQSWISLVMNKTRKSPFSRIRTRQADIRGTDLRAYGYNDRSTKKHLSGNIKLLQRTTDPQTVYRKEELHRDDIIDITDFDYVEWVYQVMKKNLNEEIATAILIGDGREDGDADKIDETHIRSIWHDDDLYCIHTDVDIAAAKAELQGTNTSANFGENYIYAEAIITAALYAREKYKGSGNLDFFCTPHLLNVMLLARDLNGRRIYESKSDLAAALNVANIQTIEQFEGKTRTTSDSKTKKLLGIFVNLADYQLGSTKGGEITRFQQFDIDFNMNKYLIETRLSGALTRVWSAIALEEPVTTSTDSSSTKAAG